MNIDMTPQDPGQNRPPKPLIRFVKRVVLTLPGIPRGERGQGTQYKIEESTARSCMAALWLGRKYENIRIGNR